MDKFALNYFEEVACKVNAVEPPERLFETSREREIVYARQMCMYYMAKELKQSKTLSAKRYGMHHATALHSIENVNNLSQTNKEFRNKMGEFLDKSNAIRLNLQDKMKFDESQYYASGAIQEAYIRDVTRAFHLVMFELFDYTDKKENKDSLEASLNLAESAIRGLREFFDIAQNDNKGDLDTKA
jgi:hypothetical protein